MSIRKKDRSFEDMLREIHVEEVPVEYIDWIKVFLDDGTEIIFNFSTGRLLTIILAGPTFDQGQW